MSTATKVAIRWVTFEAKLLYRVFFAEGVRASWCRRIRSSCTLGRHDVPYWQRYWSTAQVRYVQKLQYNLYDATFTSLTLLSLLTRLSVEYLVTWYQVERESREREGSRVEWLARLVTVSTVVGQLCDHAEPLHSTVALAVTGCIVSTCRWQTCNILLVLQQRVYYYLVSISSIASATTVVAVFSKYRVQQVPETWKSTGRQTRQ